MDIDKLRSAFEEVERLISELFFEGASPDWLPRLFGIALLFAILLLAIWAFLVICNRIAKAWQEGLWGLNREKIKKKRRLCLRRQRFSEHVERELRQLNSREEWKDYRFAELEAEVEAEGKRKGLRWFPFSMPTVRKGLRREKSLSKALEASKERLILVEGEPGSGKSVALRHVARNLARQAMHQKSTKSLIPIYINLKKLDCSDATPIDRTTIEKFVKQQLNQINDRDIESFLEEEFQEGIRNGTWFFLFDSFDELPEVLSSINADEATKKYAEAISGFLGGFNQCRGIIASRQFRGPKYLGWARFRILPLEDRRLTLIRKAELPPKTEKSLIGQLKKAPSELQDMTKNPMFLGILCENIRDGSPFPENTHDIFEIYLNKRLTRDKERLQKRFGLDPAKVRLAAEKIAFCMLTDRDLGLSPTREAIRQSMLRLKFSLDSFDQSLNALEYIKLARSESESNVGEPRLFTFSHRRFQEYFATCVVLEDLNRISPSKLLQDGRWRETAVVIFQTQPPDVFAPLLEEAEQLLLHMTENFPGLIDEPIKYIQETDKKSRYNYPPTPQPACSLPLLHLLDLLQDGFWGRKKALPISLKLRASAFLLPVSLRGTLSDRVWSLGVAGVTPQPVLVFLLRNAFSSDSQVLKEVAYRQTSRLRKVPEDISADIRKALLRLLASNRLYKERFAIHAHLSRLEQSSKYTNALKLLLWVNPIDTFAHLIILIYGSIYFFDSNNGLYDVSFSNTSILLVIVFLIFPAIIFLTSIISFRSFILGVSLTKTLDSIPQHDTQSKRPKENIENILSAITHPGNNFSLLILPAVYARVFIFLFLLLTSNISRFFVLIALWSMCAVLAVNTSQFTNLVWCPVLALFPIGYLLLKSKQSLKLLVTVLRSLWTYFLLGCYVVMFWVMLWVGNNPDNLWAKLMTDIFFAGTTILGVAFILALSFALFIWIRDWIKLRIWISQKQKKMLTGESLLNLISQFHTKTCSRQLLVTVREQNLLMSSDETKKILEELSVALEFFCFKVRAQKEFKARSLTRLLRQKRPLKRMLSGYFSGLFKLLVELMNLYKKNLSAKERKILKLISHYQASPVFSRWLRQYTSKNNYRLAELGSECLDEIYLLIEQLQVNTQSEN
ncbi:MAG: NACHT domain-containing protein [Cyanobacteria bacterium J06621_11]